MADDMRLDGWKAIANFLGRERTTAIRWANERGLPVHRVPGGRTGTVYGLQSELTAWMAGGTKDVSEAASSDTGRATARLKKRRVRVAIPLLGMSAAVVAFAFLRGTPKATSAPVSIAVVASQGDDLQARQFGDALSADLARFANASPVLAVHEQEHAASNDLQYVVRTTVDRDGDALVVNARMVATSDGAIVWSRQMRQTASGATALREQVAANIVGILRCSFGSLGKERALMKPGDLALLISTCQALVDGDDQQLNARVRALTIARPDISIGWALLGECLALAAEESNDPSMLKSARAAVQRAIAIAPDGLETYQAMVLLADQTNMEQLPILEKALQKYPTDSGLLGGLSGTLFNLGYVRESVDPVLQAIRFDPTWFAARDLAVRRLAAAGRFADAQQLQSENERLWPGHPAIIQQKRRLQSDKEETEGVGLSAKIEVAQRHQTGEPAWSYATARLYERSGDRSAALAWLRRAPVVNAQHQWSMLFWPGVDGLRAEPAFFRKMAELGLVKHWIARRKWPDFCTEPGLKYDCATEAKKLNIT